MTTATADLQAHRLPCPRGCGDYPLDCPDCDGGDKWFVGFSERCPVACDDGQNVLDHPPTGCQYCTDRPSWLEPGRVGVKCLACGGESEVRVTRYHEPVDPSPPARYHEMEPCPANCRDGYLVVEITREEARGVLVRTLTATLEHESRAAWRASLDLPRVLAAALRLEEGP